MFYALWLAKHNTEDAPGLCLILKNQQRQGIQIESPNALRFEDDFRFLFACMMLYEAVQGKSKALDLSCDLKMKFSRLSKTPLKNMMRRCPERVISSMKMDLVVQNSGTREIDELRKIAYSVRLQTTGMQESCFSPFSENAEDFAFFGGRKTHEKHRLPK
eukprot:jgi/Picsp_1/3489/NSC_06327-R1_---NA---